MAYCFAIAELDYACYISSLVPSLPATMMEMRARRSERGTSKFWSATQATITLHPCDLIFEHDHNSHIPANPLTA